jgi:hypothetical protein
VVPRRLLFEMICVRGFYFRCLAFLTHALDAPTHRYKFELLYFVTIRTLEAIVQCMHFQRHSNHSFRKNRPATRLISGMECIYATLYRQFNVNKVRFWASGHKTLRVRELPFPYGELPSQGRFIGLVSTDKTWMFRLTQ